MMKNQKSLRTIGVLSPYLGGFYYGELIAQLHRTAQENGVRLLSIRAGRRRPMSVSLALDHVDGFIIWQDSISADQLKVILDCGKPVVSMAHDFANPRITSVQSDNRGAITEATQFLIEQGHRDIVFSGYENEFDQTERLLGFRAVLARHNLPVRPSYEIMVKDAGYPGGLAAAKVLLASRQPFTAVVAATDLIALGYLDCLLEVGLRVPEDVALIGYDNLPMSRTTVPALATVDQNFPELARVTFETLLAQIESGIQVGGVRRVANLFLPRRSCGHLANPQPDDPSGQMISNDGHATEIGIGYELTKDLIGADFTTVLRRMWVLAPYLEWACIGEWRVGHSPVDYLQISDVLDLHDTGLHPLLGKDLHVAQFPPLQYLPTKPDFSDRFIVIVPVMMERHWTVLAVTGIFKNTRELARLPTLMHYIDLIGLALERSMLDDELEEKVQRRTQSLAQANAELAAAIATVQQATESLIRSDKMAALGSLVAGISHELNTPIGNSLTVATALQDQSSAFAVAMTHGLTQSQLREYVQATQQGCEIMARSLQRAAQLIGSFKQVSVDQTSDIRRRFHLVDTLSEVLLTLGPSLRKTTHSVGIDVPSDISLDSYPGAMGQIVANLINNAVMHAFEGRESGHVSIAARLSAYGRVELMVCDNGLGIAPDNLGRVFDPFFTTKLGQGGSGLGLNIVYNLVSHTLGGTITVDSSPGNGACFTLDIPLDAPR